MTSPPPPQSPPLPCLPASPLSLILVLSSSLAYYHQRMGVEEEMLLARFPDEYSGYQARTPFRLLPGVY